MEIIPSILTDSKDELFSKIESIRDSGITFQIDFMDGQFVSSRSILPDDLPEDLTQMLWEAHLMVSQPEVWSKPIYLLRASRVYWHVESF